MSRPPNNRRGWYNNRRWRRKRAAWLAQHPLCVECEKCGVVTPASVVDHVVDHGNDWNAFWLNPIRSLCRECHERKHGRDMRPLYVDPTGCPAYGQDPFAPASNTE